MELVSLSSSSKYSSSTLLFVADIAGKYLTIVKILEATRASHFAKTYQRLQDRRFPRVVLQKVYEATSVTAAASDRIVHTCHVPLGACLTNKA